MLTAIYHCNVCGKQKGESNHWMAARLTKDCGQIYQRLEIRAFDDSTSDDEHICGAECLIQRISAFAAYLQTEVQKVKDDNDN